MDCTAIGINYQISSDNKVNEALKNIISNMANGDLRKEATLLTILFNSDFISKLSYSDLAKNIINSKEFLDITENSTDIEYSRKFIDLYENIIEELIQNNSKELISQLNNYYNNNYRSIYNTTSTNYNSNNDFLSDTALKLAKDYTADLISRTHEQLKLVYEDNNLVTEVLKNVTNKIEEDFESIIFKPLYNEIKDNNTDLIKEYKEIVQKYNNTVQELNPKLKELKNAYKTAKTKKAKTEALNEYNKESEPLIELRSAINSLKIQLVDTYGNSVQRNYTGLVKNVRKNGINWYKNILSTNSKLYNIANQYSVVTNDSQMTELDYTDDSEISLIEEIDDNSKNTMAETWNENIPKSFDKLIDPSLKVEFDKLYNLSAPVEIGNRDYKYDTNNELGVRTSMNANFVITKLADLSNGESYEQFIANVYEASLRVPELYGLGKLVQDMIDNPAFGNKIFSNICNPKVKKGIVSIKNGNIIYSQSNQTAFSTQQLIYSIYNTVSDIQSVKYIDSDINNLNKILNSLNKSDLTNKEKYKISAEISVIISKYIPTITSSIIHRYLFNKNNTFNINGKTLITNINSLLNTINDIKEKIIKAKQEISDYNKKLKESQNDSNGTDDYIQQLLGIENNEKEKTEEKIEYKTFDPSSINKSSLFFPIIGLAKELSPYIATKTELNTPNAENNLSSDLINNSYITNFFKQINYGTKENPNEGLKKFAEFISKNIEQYKYNPILFGVKNSKGQYISKGLFILNADNSIKINEDAKKIIDYILFDGIKNKNNSEAAMYAKMSKSDYFLTTIFAYKNVIKTEELLQDDVTSSNLANYFMQIPSDAPKNFTIQTLKYNTSALWNIDNNSFTNYINKKRQIIIDNVNNTNNIVKEKLKSINPKNTKNKLNKTAEIIYEYIFNGKDITLKGNNLINSIQVINDENYIPVIYENGKEKTIYWFKANKNIENNNTIFYELELAYVNSNIQTNSFSNAFLEEINTQLQEEGIYNGQIIRKVNTLNGTFNALRTNLLSNLASFIDQLNSVFEFKNGYYVVKENTDNLFNNAHYKKTIVKNGKLTGNYFQLNKLFETNGYNVHEELDKLLRLYGEDNTNALINNKTFSDGKKLVIDPNNLPNYVIIENNRLKLNINPDVLNDVVENWINNFYIDLINYSNNYKTLLNEYKINTKDLVECFYNNVIAEMSFSDIFTGKGEFYKNAQDYLKRAKEVQAGGKNYGLFNSDYDYNTSIYDIEVSSLEDKNSKHFIPITYKKDGKLISLNRNIRNGFKAVTIKDVNMSSEIAADIKERLIEINKKSIGDRLKSKNLNEEQINNIVESIANEIAKGYFDTTTINDAQSFITWEEFLNRKFRDGTIDEYADIIDQIEKLRKGEINLEDLDISTINKKVQVQKNYYFDIVFDEETKSFYPRQIKNAEFVIIPELLKGTELETLYYSMIKHDIGQINASSTSKAANKKPVELWNDKGEFNIENFENSLKTNSSNIENYYYRYLYKQQDVVDHLVDKENKLGIQIAKKIVDNAPSELKKEIDSYMENYIANVREDFMFMLNTMNWRIENNKIIDNNTNTEYLTFAEFWEKAKQESQRLNLDDNTLDYLTPVIEEVFNDKTKEIEYVSTKPIMPNIMNVKAEKLESIAQSIFNNAITRQTFPGWHAVQVTSLGIGRKALTSTGERKELRYHPTVYRLKDTIKPYDVFDLNDINYDLVDIERVNKPWRNDKTKSNDTIRVYLKNQHNKGYFELVKDLEDNYYSVHFKTKNEKGQGSQEFDSTTKEERAILYEELRKLIPGGAYVSTYGELSPGGSAALDKVGKGMTKIGLREVSLKEEKGKIKIPIYANYNKQKLLNGQIEQEEYDKLSDEDKIKYEKHMEAYAEILVPRWSSLLPKNMTVEDFNKIENEGLTLQIGYRIPTEGKQSVSVLKIVGFLDDIYGSTVIVPKEWVTQTGSDFDVDTIYAMCYNMYKDNNNELKKYKLDLRDDEKSVEKRYINYIQRQLKEKIEQNVITDEKKKKLLEKYKKEVDLEFGETYEDLQSIESEQFQLLKGETKKYIIEFNKANANKKYVDRLSLLADDLAKSKYAEDAKYFINAINEIVVFINVTQPIKFNKVEEKLSKEFEKAYNKYFKQVQKAAKDANLPSFKEFSQWSIIEQNSRKSRENAMLDAIINIMSSDASFEENMSRSNFDNLSEDKNLIDFYRGELTKNRSINNPLDQIDFMENAISGKQLKALSVNRDTFNSINNRLHTTINDNQAIYAVYNLNENETIIEDNKVTIKLDQNGNPVKKYNLALLEDAFGKENISVKDNIVTVKHNKLGWSLNNRNIKGKLLLPYSSQTTAHILDAIKEGAIYNENLFTFGTFKTLIDVGIDYYTAISFLAQPGIVNISKFYNESESVYTSNVGNNVHKAIKQLAADLKIVIDGSIVNQYTPIHKIIKNIDSNPTIKNIIKELFNVNEYESFMNINYPLNNNLMTKRIKNEPLIEKDTFIDDATKNLYNKIFDLCMIVAFNNINITTKNIEAIARLTNPDKFGAKNRIRATKQVIENIEKYIEKNKKEDYNVVGNTLLVDNKPMLFSLYGIDSDLYESKNDKKLTYEDIDLSKSKYPFLASYLKYVVIPSVNINKQLFLFEDDTFSNIVAHVENYIKHKFNETEYSEFKQYLMTDLYSTIPVLQTPVDINEKGNVIIDNDSLNDLNKIDNYWKKEIYRIYGYDRYEFYDFLISDINNPTKEELYKFKRLTPAEKVMWVKMNFTGNAGIFDYLNVTLTNDYIKDTNNLVPQRIRFSEKVDDINTMLNVFNATFNNNNKFIKLAAIDLIKYAFIVEGFKFKRGSVSKLINNPSLYKTIEDGGLDIINTVNSSIQFYMDYNKFITSPFMDKFVRSHKDLIPEVKLPRIINRNSSSSNNSNITVIFEKNKLNNGLVVLNNSHEDLLEALNISESNLQKYINISRFVGTNRETTLYKIHKGLNNIYLIPLNLLERNEVTDVSINFDNNKFLHQSYYEKIINDYEIESTENSTLSDIIRNISTKDYFIKKHIPAKIQYTVSYDYIQNSTMPNINIFRNNIIKELDNNQNNISYVYEDNNKIKKLIQDNKIKLLKNNTTKIGMVQNITDSNNVTHKVFIQPFNTTKYLYGVISSYAKEKNGNGFIRFAAEHKVLQDEQLLNKIAEYINLGINPISSIYKITIINDNDNYVELNDNTTEEFEAVTSGINEQNELNQKLIDETYELQTNEDVIKQIYNDIHSNYVKYKDVLSKEFKKELDLINFQPNDLSSILNNRQNIYKFAAKYYKLKAQEYLDKLNNFEINGKTFSLEDKALYEELLSYPEYYDKLVTLILDAKTFGNRISDIMNLELTSEDPETRQSIIDIQQAINSIKNSYIVNKSLNNIFNIYFSEKYANNPLVKNGLIDITTIFNDTTFLDLTFSDIAELRHQQIQTVLKYIFTKTAEATMFYAPQNAEDFIKEYENIVNNATSLNMDKVIVNNTIKLPYTEKFISDRKEKYNKLNNIRNEYGEDSKEYLKEKLNYDEWCAKNLEQPIVQEYYLKNVELRKNVYKKASNVYPEYYKIITNIRKLNNDALTDDIVKEIEELNLKLKNLLSPVKEDLTLKDAKTLAEIKEVKQFIKDNIKLNNKYFVNEANEEFNTTLNEYSEFIDNYDKTHKEESLEEKLKNNEYRKKYNWLELNTQKLLDDKTETKLTEAFNELNNEINETNAKIKQILINAKAYTNGKIDYSKLSENDINAIYELEKSKYPEDEDSTNGVKLIKMTPKQIYKLEKKYREELQKELKDAELDKIFNTDDVKDRINDILLKALDENGEINTKSLFEKLTTNELNRLIDLYEELNERKLDKETAEKLNNIISKYYTTKRDIDRYNAELKYAKENLTKKQLEIWKKIFIVKRFDGKSTSNPHLFSYSVPNPKFVNKKADEARETINEYIKFEPSLEYYETKLLMESKGEEIYNEWYKNNHIYNPYTKTMQPISIWNTMNYTDKVKYKYIPNKNNTESREVKNGINSSMNYKNPKYTQYTVNYNSTTGEYNGYSGLTSDEIKMAEFLMKTLETYTTTNTAKHFIREGNIPRRFKNTVNTKYLIKEFFGAFGIEMVNSPNDKYTNQIDYIHDKDAIFPMLQELKGKGYKPLKEIPPKSIFESDEDYNAKVEKINKENEAIKKKNKEIDLALSDKNYKEVFKEFVYNATIFNMRQQLKNTLYLLQEDVKDRDAFSTHAITGELKKDKKLSTEQRQEYIKEKQENTLKLLENFMRRYIFGEFKKESKLARYANLAQNITSAKYMIFNIPGGIANVGTGNTNMAGEAFANDYFGGQYFAEGKWDYISNSMSFISDMYKETSNNLQVAISKLFDIVDLDAMLNRVKGDKASEISQRIRDSLYSSTSIGEHYMQNSVLFAMIKSHRIYKDKFTGKPVIGSISDYIKNIETETMLELLKDNPVLLKHYKLYAIKVKQDTNKQLKYATFKSDFNKDFLKEINDKNLTDKYIKLRKTKIKEQANNFEKEIKLNEQFILKDGKAVIKNEEILTKEMLAEFKSKVERVNNKIHGVYNRLGAARIESEWWGGLVMQYHKHLYPGIMKRFRTNGYYNEIRNSVEKGSYISLFNLLTADFDGIKARIKNRKDNNEIAALASVKEVVRSLISSLINIKFNYSLMPEWEKRNMKRILGDLTGAVAAMLLAVGIRLIWDDDELEESNIAATSLYIADRLFSEAIMYNPAGMYSEFSTLWSSPIASLNGASDVLKGVSVLSNMLFDKDFNPIYTTGLYKGQHKALVMLYRNIPIYRMYQRLNNMTRNNSYYRINETSFNIGVAEDIVNFIKD